MLRHQLGNDEPRLDGLAEPHLVGKDAPALGNPPQRKHHGIDLMRIRIHPPPPLRSDMPPPLPRPPEPHELLGVKASMDGVHGHGPEV